MQFLAWLMALLFLLLLLGCHLGRSKPHNRNCSTDYRQDQSLQEIVDIISPRTPNGKAHVYVFAPHILGLWDDPQPSAFEYFFVSQFLTKNSEPAYELLGLPANQTCRLTCSNWVI